MGAMISILCDAKTVSDDDATNLAQGMQVVVKEVMSAKDVFVYVEKPLLTLADPIEVFVQVNKSQVDEPARLTEAIATRLKAWKQENQFELAVNINVNPVEWHHKIGI